MVAALVLPGSAAAQAADPLAEIKGLAIAAGAQVVDAVVQRRPQAHPRTGFGKGKVLELEALCKQHGAQVLIVDFDLSPS
ncbi:MAG: GTPase HflX, partial [Planctomycetes bacterium]|nr:GTPase HflX [Planctomycetota bacterium]